MAIGDRLTRIQVKAREGIVVQREGIVAQTCDSAKLWGTMVKQTSKRRRPGFNDSFYGFGSFNESRRLKHGLRIDVAVVAGCSLVAGFASAQNIIKTTRDITKVSGRDYRSALHTW
jgi:hypothetical protein